ncbi:MAG: YegS/Rv2252/BmrU family lipid kinase [Tetragenococcus koreensis]|nr:YegS/Rv2252/BmrU family lipid kinase [Tetragenococcus koreensis]
MEKIFIIINPTAGDEEGKEVQKRLEAIYEKKGVKTASYQTTGEDDFEEIIQKAVEKGFKKLLVSGGDGTISEVVNGLAEFEEIPEIILLPSGTKNNFSQSISKGKTRAEIIEAIELDDLTKIKADLGRLNGQYFISSIAFGLLPAVGWETDKKLKAEIGSFAYFLEGLKYVKEEDQESFELRIQFDEEEKIEENVFLFIVGLSNSIFGVQGFFEGASVHDGKLHYFALKKSDVWSEINAVLNQLKKNPKDEGLTVNRNFKRAKIESNSELNFLIDGEKGPKLPVDIGILEEHITFLIPRE